MDKLQIVNFPYYGSYDNVLYDLNDGTYVSNVRDTFKLTPPTKNQQFSQSQRPYGGSNLTNETHDNGFVEAESYITGTTKDDSLARMEAIINLFENFKGNYVKWQPDGASFPIFYEIKANMPYEFQYRWIEFNGQKTLHIKWQLAVAPLGEGYSLFGNDNFNANTGSSLAHYGALGRPFTSLTLNSNWLVNSLQTSLQAQADKTLSIPSIAYENTKSPDTSELYASMTFGLPVGGLTGGDYMLLCTCVTTSVAYGFKVYDNGSSGVIDFVSIDLSTGTTTALATNTSVSLRFNSAAASAGQIFLVEGMQRERLFAGRCYKVNSQQAGSPMGSHPPSGATVISCTNVGGSTRPDLANGSPGMGFYCGLTQVYNFSWSCYPNTNILSALPNTTYSPEFKVPGTAPAKADLYVEVESAASPFAAFAWGLRPLPYNLLKNGNFDVDNTTFSTDPTFKWSTTTALDVSASATSLTVNTGAAITGTYGLQVVFPTTANSGISAVIPGEFKAGRSYMFSIDYRLISGSAFSPRISIGRAGDYSAGPQTVIGPYTFPYDSSSLTVAIGRSGTGGGSSTVAFDNITVMEVTDDQTFQVSTGQRSGRNGHPTFGPLIVSNGEIVTGTGISSGSTGRYGSSVSVDTGNAVFSTGGSCSLGWWIDSTLLPDDAKTLTGETTFEVWGYFSALPATVQGPSVSTYIKAGELGLNASGPTTYADVGSSGISPAVGLNRLGTITVSRPSIGDEPRYRLYVNFNFGAGSTGTVTLDYAYLLPTSRKAATPTAIAYDATTYPAFAAANQGKLVKADGTSFIRNTSVSDNAIFYPDHGLGGAPIRLTPNQRFQLTGLLGAGGPGTDTAASLMRAQLLVTSRYYIVRPS